MVVRMFDCKLTANYSIVAGKPGLDFAAFLALQLFMVKHLASSKGLDVHTAPVDDIDRACVSVRAELEALGFDPNTLSLVRGRELTLVLHTDLPVELEAITFDADAFEEAIELPIIATGECHQLDNSRIQFYSKPSGYNGISFVAVNASTSVLHFALDCSKSVNAMSHTGSLVAVVRIEAGQAKLLQHLLPACQDSEWSWSYEASYRWEH